MTTDPESYMLIFTELFVSVKDYVNCNSRFLCLDIIFQNNLPVLISITGFQRVIVYFSITLQNIFIGNIIILYFEIHYMLGPIPPL